MVANNLEDTPRGFSRETFDANVSNQLLADYYYPAFRASIVAADAKGAAAHATTFYAAVHGFGGVGATRAQRKDSPPTCPLLISCCLLAT